MQRFTNAPFYKVPRSYPFDFAMTDKRGDIFAVAEVKNRSYAFADIPDYMIAANKIMKLLAFGERLSVDCYLVVNAPDGLFFWHLDPKALDKFRLTMGGRSDRNDPADSEPVCRLPLDWFERVG